MLIQTDIKLPSQIVSSPPVLFPFPLMLKSRHTLLFFLIPLSPQYIAPPFHSFAGDVGSSSNIPSFISSSAFGRCSSFCSRLSARMCFCNSRCCPCIAGAALESGRMFPKSTTQTKMITLVSRFGNTSQVVTMNGWMDGVVWKNGQLYISVRSISSSRSGRFSSPFRKLSLACWRSNSSCADCIALFARGGVFPHPSLANW